MFSDNISNGSGSGEGSGGGNGGESEGCGDVRWVCLRE